MRKKKNKKKIKDLSLVMTKSNPLLMITLPLKMMNTPTLRT